MLPKAATEVDQTVGARIAALRKARGLSQTALGDVVGVTFQQIQKYEKGQNRVGASRLQSIAKVLDVPVSTLFSDDAVTPEQAHAFDFLSIPGAVEMLKAFAAIQDAQLRREVLAIARSAARLGAVPATDDA